MSQEPAEAPRLLNGFSREYLLHHGFCPVEEEVDGVLRVAAATELPEDVLDDLELTYHSRVVVTQAQREEVEALIERTGTRAESTIEFEAATAASDEQTADVRDLANQPPVIRYVNLLMRDAYHARASDVHLEAERDRLSPVIGSTGCSYRRWRRRPASIRQSCHG